MNSSGKTALAYPVEDLGDFKFWCLSRPNAYRVLDKIIFEWRNASARFFGCVGKWVAYCRDQWMAWTNLTRRKYDAAVQELVAIGFLRKEIHKFGGNSTRTFYQPTEKGLRYAGKPKDLTRIGQESEHSNVHSSVHSHVHSQVQSQTLPISLSPDLPQKNVHSSYPEASASQIQDHPIPSPEELLNPKAPDGSVELPAQPESKGLPAMKHPPGHTMANAVLSVEQQKQANLKLHGVGPLQQLERTWLKTIKAVTDVPVMKLSGKDRGMLKHFLAACPAGMAIQVLDTVMNDWHMFTKRAATDEAAFPIPEKPRIDFMLKYVLSAIKMTMDAEKKAQKHEAQVATKSVVPKSDVQLIAPKPTYTPPAHVPMTEEELNEFMYGDD